MPPHETRTLELDGSPEVVHTNSSLHPILTLALSREALSAMTLPDVHPYLVKELTLGFFCTANGSSVDKKNMYMPFSLATMAKYIHTVYSEHLLTKVCSVWEGL